MNVREELFLNQDLKYRDFHSKLMPSFDKNFVIGVRMPVLRKIAKEIANKDISFEAEYYEEKMLKGLVIGYRKNDIDSFLKELEEFIPLIDNWAVCDCCASGLKLTEKHMKRVWDFLMPYLNKSEYEIRFAVVMLLDYYINEDYIDSVIEVLTNIKSDEYYVNMAVAWAVSVAFVKFEDKIIPLFENHVLDKTVEKMAVRKISDSLRVPKQTKQNLKRICR